MKTFTKPMFAALLLVVMAAGLLISAPVFAQDGTTIRYANWNVGTEEENNLQRQLVAQYVEAHPGVTVEFVDMSGDGSWEEKLTNLAARGELPDVFMANNTPLYVQNGWLADLTARVQDDPDWANVPQVLRDAMTFDGKVMGLPAAEFVLGYFINHDLFEAANLDAPAYCETSVDDFFTAASALTNVDQGVLGLHEFGPILGWFPSTQDESLGWFSFDGEHMNYNSDAFRSAVDTAIAHIPDTWQGLTDEQKANFVAQGPWELFVNQESGAVWEGGWAVPNFVQNGDFNWDFLGIPGCNQAIVGDFLTVSATAADQDAAYDFANWMSFNSAGYAAEAALAEAAGSVPTRMPVSVTPESIALYMSFVGDKPGLQAALENLDGSLVESLAKIVPGYIQARWEGHPGLDVGDQTDVTLGWIFDNINNPNFKFEDVAAQLQDFANNILDEAHTQMSGS